MELQSAGVVGWFNKEKGYGFIKSNNPQDTDVYAHCSEIKSLGKRGTNAVLQKGEHVEFDLYVGPKGLVAKNIVHL